MNETLAMNGYVHFTAPSNKYGIEDVFYNEFLHTVSCTWDKETVKNSQELEEMKEVNDYILTLISEHQKAKCYSSNMKQEFEEHETDLEKLARAVGSHLVKEKEKAEQRSKYDTLEELFFSKYDLNDISENPFALWDAIGFIKGIKHLAPTWCPGSANKILKRLYEMQEYSANRNREWLKEVFR